jgi:hypothetical protein
MLIQTTNSSPLSKLSSQQNGTELVEKKASTNDDDDDDDDNYEPLALVAHDRKSVQDVDEDYDC